jgi:hypothetical protein
MLVLSRSGQIVEAQALIDKYLAYPNPDNEMLIEITRALSQCSQAASIETDEHRFRRMAIQTLKTAAQKGFTDTVFLLGELDLKPLRGLTEFQSLANTP